MSSTETIGALRNSIATKSQVEAQKQRLIFCGRLLSNDAQTLTEAGMSDDCALHMVASRASGTTPNSGARQPPQQQQQPQFDQPPPEFMRFISNMVGRPWEHTAPFQQSHLTDSPEEDGGNGHTRSRSFDRAMPPLSPPPRNYPLNERSPAETFQAIPGTTPIPHRMDIQLPSTGAYLAHTTLQEIPEPERLPPTVAQANELIYDLFTHVLPSIRRHPEHEGFQFSTTDSTSPTFISSSAPDPIRGAGGALINLGDAFTELGRSLREVGQGWQAHNSSTDADDISGSAAMRNNSSLVRTQAVLHTLIQLMHVSPLAVPFLQSTIARTHGSEPQMHANSSGSSDPTSANTSSGRRTDDTQPNNASERGYQDSMHRRARRHNALVNLVVDTNRTQDRNNVHANPFSAAFGNAGISIIPSIFIEPNFAEHSRDRTDNSARNLDTRTSSTTGNAGSSTNSGSNISSATRNAAHGERSGASGLIGNPFGTARVVHRTMRSIGGNHVIEAIIQQIGVPEHQEPSTSAGMPPLNIQTNQLNQQHQQQRQQQQQQRQQQRQPSEHNAHVEINISNGAFPSQSTASSVSDNDVITPTSADGSNGFYSFLERLRTLSNRNTAPSDRSNTSTTTEYSTGNGVSSARTQRMFTINGGVLGSPSVQQTQAMNPFSFASMFLGVEPGSTRNTSRRTSLSSNVGGGNDASTGPVEARAAHGNASNNNVQMTSGSGAESAPAVASSSIAAVDRRTGETRPRGLSSNALDSSHGEGSSSSRSSSGSNKRHKANDASESDR
ncbi:hypothetical protein EV175_003902 [Coemansia sp. RSA 1933]|nr:hypothetical protein EV175_003902 [Coemansia sp. RSA 1933]